MSLRSRLTFSYTFAVALFLLVAAVTTSQLAFWFLMHPMMEAVRDSAATVRRVVLEHPNVPEEELETSIVLAASRSNVSIVMIPKSILATGHAQELIRGLPGASFMTKLGFTPVFIPVRNGTVLIAPDFRSVDPVIKTFLGYLLASGFGAFIVAWFIARWITSQALDPLVLVSSELERFGRGDFSTRPMMAGDNSELGRLTTAYNAASTQVSAAFEERERIAREMQSLLGDAGHALRTPLTVISGFIEVLDDAGMADARTRGRALRSMRIEARRMRLLVEGVMSLARLEHRESRTPTRVDVDEIAATAIEQIRTTRGGDITLRRSEGEMVVADASDFHEAVINLIENAVKYGAGSRVAVEIEREGVVIVVRVRDHGPGIPKAEQTRVFERFFRGGDALAQEGSGLGLAIVAGATRRCGGTAKLECADAGCTSFVLRLPAAKSAYAAGGSEQTDAREVQTSSR